MSERIAEEIRTAVREERCLFGAHADQRIRERKIVRWQIVAEMDAAKLIRKRPDASPNPAAKFDLFLADGTSVSAIRSWIGLRPDC
jgi:hypothetical protein